MTSAGTTYAKGAIIGVSRRDALAELGRRQRAGLIHSAGQVARITKGERAGQYAIPVYLITSPRPAPRGAPVYIKVAVVLSAASALVTALAWLLLSLTAASLLVFGGLVLLALVGRLVTAHGLGRKPTTVTTTVTFK
jgi:hypothetical protein